MVDLLEIHLVENSLYLGFHGSIFSAIALIEDLALCRSAALQSLVDHPRALVVLNIGSNLSNLLWLSENIKVVILSLEVLAQWDEDIMSLTKILRRGKLEVMQSKSNRKVEAVVGSLVDDNEVELVHVEVVQVDVVFRGSDKITQLAEFSLEGNLVEELDKIDICRVRAEVFLQENVDRGLEHEGIVDCNHADSRAAVPARLATTSDRAVHYII